MTTTTCEKCDTPGEPYEYHGKAFDGLVSNRGLRLCPPCSRAYSPVRPYPGDSDDVLVIPPGMWRRVGTPDRRSDVPTRGTRNKIRKSRDEYEAWFMATMPAGDEKTPCTGDPGCNECVPVG